jgi:predicted nucleic acid-binding protein
MINLILDTNIWIYLAQGKHPYILDKILEKKDKREVQFIVCELQILEWERNKDKIKYDIVESLKFQYNAAKNISKYIKDEDRDTYIKIIERNYKNEELLIHHAEQKYFLIENLLKNHSKIAPLTNEQKLIVANWAIEGKAPFHKKSNSYADALILLSGIEYVKENSLHKLNDNDVPLFPDSIFVSYNHTDFSKSDKKTEIDLIHPDLEPLLESVKMKYMRQIDKFLVLSNEMQIEIDEYWDYVDSLIDGHIQSQIDIMRGK